MFGFNKTTKKFLDLRGKVAIVTGAGRGMGRTHALTLAQAGAKVVVSDISLENCQNVVQEIKKERGEAFAVKCDISLKADVDGAVKMALEKFSKIDILVNNAGIFPFAPFLEMKEQDFQKVIDINLKGYFLMSQACAKEMAKNQPDEKGLRGAIVNIGSIAMGQVGMGFAGLVHYCASKGGIAGMAEAMSLELAPLGIRVNTIAPGAIDTPGASSPGVDNSKMLEGIPMKRQGKDQEVSNAVLFLASDESSYMTGSVVTVDGGWTAT